MRKITLAALFTSVAVLTGAAIVSCTGDEPAPLQPFDDSGGGGATDTGTTTDGAPTCKGDEVTACGASCTKCPEPGANGKATCVGGACGVECTAPAVACGSKCATLSGDPDHCGACNHSCGGGACLNGVCQPTPVVQGLTGAVAFALAPNAVVISMTNILGACDLPAGCGASPPRELAKGYKSMGPLTVLGTDVYWIGGSQGDSDAIFLRRCPLAGCPAGVVPALDTDTNATIDRIAGRGTTLVWRRVSGGGQIRSCALPACSPVTTIIQEPNLRSLATDGTSIFYGRTGAPPALYKCAANAVCTAPPVHSTGRVGGPAFRELGGVLYGVDTGEVAGINDGYVWTANAAAAGATTTFAREELGPTDLAVDADDVAWINPTLKTVSTCKKTGCVGAARVLAREQVGLVAIASDAKFVYWLTDTAVFKVAK